MGFRTKSIESLLAATGRRCCICSSLHNVQVHHIVPKEKGGSDQIDNAIPLCPNCHDEVHGHSGSGRTTRKYTFDELKLHRQKAIKRIQTTAAQPHSISLSSVLQEEPQTHSPKQMPNISSVNLTSEAKKDCRRLNIDADDTIAYVVREAARHPILFTSVFNSVSFIFGDDDLLISWNGSVATIERILRREEAYPLNDIWSSCLALYRKAAMLSYRTKGIDVLFLTSEARKAINLFRQLNKRMKEFSQKSQTIGPITDIPISTLDSLLEEAEFALANDDRGSSVVRMEALLSSIHKLLVRYAPQGRRIRKLAKEKVLRAPEEQLGKTTVLCAEDDRDTRMMIAVFLRRHGYDCVEAKNARQALQILVERDFDVILTDLVMPEDNIGGGRELVLAAKKMGSKAKILLLTAFGFDGPAQKLREHCDGILTKLFTGEELLEAIEDVLRDRATNELKA